MKTDMEQLYSERLNRYVTAMRNGKPDKVPIRPFVAEFVAKYAGYTCQDVTHDYRKAFSAVRQCAQDFDWDAVVANMVYVWTGLTQAIGLKYYGVPGIDISPDVGFQYREPAEADAHMLPEEYDELIEDPTGFLYNTWLPRVSTDVAAADERTSFRNNLSFVKGGMAMLQYFMAFGPQVESLRRETATVPAIAGILKAPLDIIADKLRGYIGLCFDLLERPEKVLAACQALAPHLAHVAISTADPTGTAPVGFWMHRGCVPLISQEHFDTIYWKTLKPVIEKIWSAGHQTLFYAEGKWGHHLKAFAELPDGSIIYHIDRDDVRDVHTVLGKKFCLSGGIPNTVLSIGTPDEVRAKCKEVIDIAAQDGGYIMDASAIIQNDAKVENIRAMTDFTREYGVYSEPSSQIVPDLLAQHPESSSALESSLGKRKPGICIPWEEKLMELPPIKGDEQLAKSVWEEIDAWGYMYIWQCLLSF